MIAFAARYGHTSPDVTRRMPVTELMDFVNAVAELMEEESQAARSANTDD